MSCRLLRWIRAGSFADNAQFIETESAVERLIGVHFYGAFIFNAWDETTGTEDYEIHVKVNGVEYKATLPMDVESETYDADIATLSLTAV